ncbi:MAG: phage integrase N-terminal SAM-like domain-containing protein [Spirochaetales bacterium]|nr:phage integrase N-terminal SAM-like domain-containing protein [Spirochaetales bacterium]
MVISDYYEKYKEIVLKNQQIKVPYKKFYIIWVELFLDYLKKNNMTENKQSKSEKLTHFTNFLYNSKKYQDWQINQAVDAINLFYTLINNTEDSVSLDSIVEQIRNTIKIKHYSNKTEKNYVYWVKQFYHFLSKSILNCNSTDVKNFLTYLAKEKNVSASTQNQAFQQFSVRKIA